MAMMLMDFLVASASCFAGIGLSRLVFDRSMKQIRRKANLRPVAGTHAHIEGVGEVIFILVAPSGHFFEAYDTSTLGVETARCWPLFRRGPDCIYRIPHEQDIRAVACIEDILPLMTVLPQYAEITDTGDKK